MKFVWHIKIIDLLYIVNDPSFGEGHASVYYTFFFFVFFFIKKSRIRKMLDYLMQGFKQNVNKTFICISQ